MTTEYKLPECVVVGFNPDPAATQAFVENKKRAPTVGRARLESLQRRYIKACTAEQNARRKKNELLKAIRQCKKASRMLRTTRAEKTRSGA